MIDKIEQYAMLKYAGDKEAVAHFVDGFVKEANFLDDMLNAPTGGGFQISKGGPVKQPDSVQHAILKGIGGSFGQGIGNLAVTAGVTSIGSLYNSVKNKALHSKFSQALERAYQSNRILKEAEKEKVLQYAETVFKFAPNVATDSNLLSSILANAIHGDGIDPMTIKTLTELEAKYTDNTSFNPKTYSK